MEVVSFRWWGRYGHFLQADAGASALTYPLPPRTAALGVVAAVLGLEKDTLPTVLSGAQVAVQGAFPRRFWHGAKLRKNLPPLLPLSVKKSQSGSDSDEQATLIKQEWLLSPDYTVHLALPDHPALQAELAGRLQERRWHFSPCLGLSEHQAEVALVSSGPAMRLPAGRHTVQGACPADNVRLLPAEGLGLHLLRLPHSVTIDRVFSHRSYYLEHRGRPFPVETPDAWRLVDGSVAVFC